MTGGTPRALYRDTQGAIRRDIPPEELPAILERAKAGDGWLWVDVDGKSESECSILASVFQFHPLAIEDALHANSRGKVEDYDGQYLLIVLRGVRLCVETEDDPYDTETINITLFVGRQYLVTVHDERALSVEEVAELARKNPELLSRGPARVAHMIADHTVDAFFPILDSVDEFVDGLEERVFARFDHASLQEIFRVKRLVLSLRRYLAPQRDVFNTLSNRPTPLLPPEVQIYFRDVYDHVLRINDSLETYRDLLSGTLDAYLSQVSNQLGQVTKGLSVVATLSLPFVVISGMWGMNVAEIPLSHHPHGFALLVALQLSIGVVLVAALRWRKVL
ncbi:MAG: magnesium transporter CorA family protein [Gemmatimonadota bacterium]|nr:magnesium transporter CorA family protein [Gemmatimonadota bacterium]